MTVSLIGHGCDPWRRAVRAGWRSLLGPALLSLCLHPAHANLGMADAARLALENQPQLLAQQAGIDALRENAVAVGELPDPRLRVGIANLPVDSFSFPEEPMTQAVLGFSQAIPGGDKRRLAADRQAREAGQGEAGLAALRQRLVRDARLAWLDAWWPGTALDFVGRIEQTYAAQVEWSEVAYKTGKLPQEETLALRGMLEATRDRATELARQQARARAVLARWVGEPAAAQPLAALLPDEPPPPAQADLAARLDGHPELAVAAAGVQVARADADLAREAYKSDWNVDVSYGLRGADRSDFLSVMVGVDLPLFTTNRQDRRLAARLAGVARAEQMAADRRLALKAELAAAFADWQAATARLARYDRDILPLAERRAESALIAYGTDRASYGRVLEARRAVLEARLQRLAQHVAQVRAAVQLRYFSE